MRISTAQLFRQATLQIQRHGAELARTQEVIASGRNILRPADDPNGAKHVLELDHSISMAAQFQANADQATNRLSLEETALGGATTALQRVRELVLQSANGTMTDPDREAIATEIVALKDQLLATANTRDSNHEYLFSGNMTATQAFVVDSTSGSVVYQGDEGQRRLRIGDDFEIAVGDSGAAVFERVRTGNGTFATREDPANTGTGVISTGSVVDAVAYVPDTYSIEFLAGDLYEVRDSGGALVASGSHVSDAAITFAGVEVAIGGEPAAGDRFEVAPSTHQDVFTTVDEIVGAMRSVGDDAADRAHFANAVNRFLVDVDQGLENIQRVRSAVGARLNSIDAEKAVHEGFEVFAKQTRSEVQDVDYAEAVSKLQLQLTALQASQQAFVSIQGLSLFNFL